MTFDPVKYAVAERLLPNDRMLSMAGLITDDQISTDRWKFSGSGFHKNNPFYAKGLKFHLIRTNQTIFDFLDQVFSLKVEEPHKPDGEILASVYGTDVRKYGSNSLIDVSLGSIINASVYVNTSGSMIDLKQSIARQIILHAPYYREFFYTETDSRAKPNVAYDVEEVADYTEFFSYFYNFIENEEQTLRAFMTTPETEVDYMLNIYEIYKSGADWPKLSRLVRSMVPMNEWKQYLTAPMAWLDEVARG